MSNSGQQLQNASGHGLKNNGIKIRQAYELIITVIN